MAENGYKTNKFCMALGNRQIKMTFAKRAISPKAKRKAPIYDIMFRTIFMTMLISGTKIKKNSGHPIFYQDLPRKTLP
jgi:hypothetical protein